MIDDHRRLNPLVIPLLGLLLVGTTVSAAVPVPRLDVVSPAGGRVGTTVELTISGSSLEGLRTLESNAPGVRGQTVGTNRVQLSIPADTPPGLYDLWAVGDHGVSAPRTFCIGNRAEVQATEPNEAVRTAMPVPLDTVINGQIEKGGDVDHFQFECRRGQRVIIECWAHRIDSRFTPVLEILDAGGRRMKANRGKVGPDPYVDFLAPVDGAYIVRVHDLISSGSAEHYYRLEIDSGPRVAFSVPSVIERGKPARVTLYGWNLTKPDKPARAGLTSSAAGPSGSSGPAGVELPVGNLPLDQVEVEIPAAQAEATWPWPVRLSPAQAVWEGFAYQFPAGHAPLVIGVTDVPVEREHVSHQSAGTAQMIPLPCEVSGQLVDGDECDWFAVTAARGEVLYLEGLGERIGSPVDLQISVLSDTGEQELARFGDEQRNLGGQLLPTSHVDPSGRWVVPADGRYLIAVRNLTGGLRADPSRTYRLSVRREEPSFHLVASPRRENGSGLNLPRGGREVFDVVVLRRRGLDEPIRITARDLPRGVECPDVWLGPGVDRTAVVISADRNAEPVVGELRLEGISASAGRQSVRGGAVVRSGLPNGWSRLTSRIPLAVAGQAPLTITADAHETLDHHLYGKLRVRHAPGGVVDVAIRIERQNESHQAPVKLTGIGLPESIRNATSVIPAGDRQGYVSFRLPPTLAEGRYSWVIAAETTVATADNKTEGSVVFSNPVTIDVQPAAFTVEVDPFAPTRVRRGQTIQVSYGVARRNGFIGKVHTELAAPGKITTVVGLRGRGETFVGQVERGSLQITINDDAPLGPQPFLRLLTIGVVEDEARFQGADLFPLEIVE